MCVRKRGTQTLGATDRDWYFENKTVQSTIELVRYLMEKYHIPADHVIRHYDVTGKICPNPYVYNEGKSTWDTFKKAISAKMRIMKRKSRCRKSGIVSAKPGKMPAVRLEHLRH